MTNSLDFTDRTVLVTGGAGGFGGATARTFAEHGARVVIADLDLDAANALAATLPNAIAVQTDVTDPDALHAAVAAAVEHGGGLDVLVNNAGAPNRGGPLEEVSLEVLDWLYQINLRSTVIASQAALPHLRRSEHAAIVNVASISAKRPRPGHAVYCALKAGVETFTRALAVEVAPRVRVNAVSPVIAETGFVANAFGAAKLTDEQRSMMVSGIPMGRTAVPQDVANAVLYLASDLASFETGVCLDVDGGRSIS